MTAPRPHALAALLLATLFSTSACGETVMPEPKRNPNPSQVYEVTFTVRDAPGPIEFTEGFAQYEVTDESCLPLSDPIAGVKQRPMAKEPLVFEKVSETAYRARVVADPFVDEDYFGLGVCRWELIAAVAASRVGEARLVADASGPDIMAGRSVPQYFRKRLYGVPMSYDTSLGGITGRAAFPEPDSELFTITPTIEAPTHGRTD